MRLVLGLIIFFSGVNGAAQPFLNPDNEMIEIEISLIDQKTKVPAILSLIFIYTVEDTIITQSDFDGKAYFSFCPDRVIDKEVGIFVTPLQKGYPPNSTTFAITKDTLITLELKNDTSAAMVKKFIESFTPALSSLDCSPVPSYPDAEKYYEHCDGRVLPKSKISELEMKSGTWRPLTNDNFLIPVCKNDCEIGDSIKLIQPKGNLMIDYGTYYYAPGTDIIKNYGYVYKKSEKGTLKLIAIDREGKELFEVYLFDNGPDSIIENRFRIIIDGKIGYANENGKIVIPPTYTCAMPFQNGKARVTYTCQQISDGEYGYSLSDSWFYIDLNGNLTDE